MTDNSSFLANIEKIDSELKGESLSLDAATGMRSDEVCNAIKKIEGPVRAIIPFVEKIPVYGTTIAQALKLLLAAGEALCD